MLIWGFGVYNTFHEKNLSKKHGDHFFASLIVRQWWEVGIYFPEVVLEPLSSLVGLFIL
jgi:hypothetical protein